MSILYTDKIENRFFSKQRVVVWTNRSKSAMITRSEVLKRHGRFHLTKCHATPNYRRWLDDELSKFSKSLHWTLCNTFQGVIMVLILNQLHAAVSSNFEITWLITPCIVNSMNFEGKCAISLRTGSQRKKMIWRASGSRSVVTPREKRVGRGGGGAVDIVFNVPLRPSVISLLRICQGGN